MNPRLARIAMVVLALNLLSSCAATGLPDSAADSIAEASPGAAEFEQTLAHLAQTEPQSPAAFAARLDYASFLATGSLAQCGPNLQQAQAQLDQVENASAVQLVLPAAAARIADLEYRIHLGRAVCPDIPPSQHSQELAAAAEAARRASDLYRQALEYRSMTAMQFNVGIVHRQMNDLSGAVAAVESAMALDREYGFEDDARDNYAALVRWNAPPESLTQAAALLQDFPTRSVTLRFGWHSAGAHVNVDLRHWSVHGNDDLIETHELSELTQQIRAAGRGWRVTTEEQNSSYEPGAALVQATERSDDAARDDDFSQRLVMLFARSLPRPADFEVTDKGQFEHALRTAALATHLRREEHDLEKSRWGDIHSQHLTSYATAALAAALSPSVIEAKTAQAESLETGAWNGATLEQGVWYVMRAPLFIPGTPANPITNRVDFSYTRPVACTPDATESSCAEIVVRFAPEPDELAVGLDDITRLARLPRGDRVDYQAATYLRLVTDPRTLMPYLVDQRRYSYLSVVSETPDEIIELEHSTAIIDYQR